MAAKKRAFLLDYAQIHKYFTSIQQKIQKKEAVRGRENNRVAENQTCESIFHVDPES